MHYYFYFIDEDFGLCYVRVPTWAPFRLQVYFNGHSWLARQLLRVDIPFEMADNAFLSLAEPERALKLYDKFALISRVECTANDVSFFKHHRYVEQRNGERVFKLAPLRKSIYSLNDLRQLMLAANNRYLAFMACIDNPDAEHKALAEMAAPAKCKGRTFRGFNLFLDPDYQLFLTLARGEWSISGFRAADLRKHIPGLTTGRSSYLLKRLRTHGLIKKVSRSYKYYLTKLGRRVLVTALVIREYFVQPTLAREAL